MEYSNSIKNNTKLPISSNRTFLLKWLTTEYSSSEGEKKKKEKKKDNERRHVNEKDIYFNFIIPLDQKYYKARRNCIIYDYYIFF